MGRVLAIALAATVGFALISLQAVAGPPDWIPPDYSNQKNCGFPMGNVATVVIIRPGNKVEVCMNENLVGDRPAHPSGSESFSMIMLFESKNPNCVTYYDSTGTERTFCK